MAFPLGIEYEQLNYSLWSSLKLLLFDTIRFMLPNNYVDLNLSVCFFETDGDGGFFCSAKGYGGDCQLCEGKVP